jgi:hypothetical protein
LTGFRRATGPNSAGRKWLETQRDLWKMEGSMRMIWEV